MPTFLSALSVGWVCSVAAQHRGRLLSHSLRGDVVSVLCGVHGEVVSDSRHRAPSSWGVTTLEGLWFTFLDDGPSLQGSETPFWGLGHSGSTCHKPAVCPRLALCCSGLISSLGDRTLNLWLGEVP
jgi:hypothetical protein